jgi:transcriptional regulator with XRE-family HTH domain
MSDILSSKKFTPSDLFLLGKRIKDKRKEKCLTQQAFAKSLGISPNYLSEIEKGKKEPSEVILRAIESRYAIDYMWLTTGSEASMVDYEKRASESIADGGQVSYFSRGEDKMRAESLAIVDEIMSSKNEMVRTALWSNLITFRHTVMADEENKRLKKNAEKAEGEIKELKKQVSAMMKTLRPADHNTGVKGG